MAIMLAAGDVAQLDGVADWQLSATGSWETLDIDSAYGSLPADCSGVMLIFENTNVSSDWGIGARHPDHTAYSAVDDFNNESRCSCFVACDSTSHEIEIYRENSDISVYLVGYFTTDAIWELSATAPPEVTPGTTGSWQDVDLSSYTDSNGELFAIIESQSPVGAGHNCRYNGATDSRTLSSSIGHGWYIVPLDGSDIIEIYAENATPDFFLLGFITAGTKETGGDGDLTDGSTTGSFYQITVPTAGKEIAILEPYIFGTRYYDIRPVGASSYPGIYSDNNQGGCFVTMLIDGSNEIDIKVENTGQEFYCWGYLEDAAAGTTSPVRRLPYNRYIRNLITR